MRAIDEALARLGELPVAHNRYFHATRAMAGDLLAVVVEKPGAAPLAFVLGQDFDVWLGPYSGVFVCAGVDSNRELISETVERMLSSRVGCESSRRSILITFAIGGSEPWLTLRVRGASGRIRLQDSYPPYSSA